MAASLWLHMASSEAFAARAPAAAPNPHAGMAHVPVLCEEVVRLIDPQPHATAIGKLDAIDGEVRREVSVRAANLDAHVR